MTNEDRQSVRQTIKDMLEEVVKHTPVTREHIATHNEVYRSLLLEVVSAAIQQQDALTGELFAAVSRLRAYECEYLGTDRQITTFLEAQHDST